MNGAEQIRAVLSRALADSSDVQVLGEAVSLSPATTGLMAEYPDQVHLLPAADATLIGVAVGMAIGGKRPVVGCEEGRGSEGGASDGGSRHGASAGRVYRLAPRGVKPHAGLGRARIRWRPPGFFGNVCAA